MKTLQLFLILFLWSIHPYQAAAQGENNIWAFGDSTGLDFSSGTPSEMTTNIVSWESSAAICDPEGRLLFYCGTYDQLKSGGKNIIWDATHTVMPNSDSLIGNKYTSSCQGVTIVPFMDGSNKYFLFLQASRENLWEEKDHYLRYSVIDMDLRGGLGDVVPGYKNMIIDSFISEKLAVTMGPDCSVWLISHRADTNVFHAFKIDAGGISPTAVVSGFPSIRLFSYSPSKENPYAFGGMDVSTDGRFIATSSYYTPYVLELFDFDKNTGILSNARTIDSIFSYSVQFSPDGSKLYTTGPVAQYNLSLLPSLAAVKASRSLLGSSSWLAGMRIGPDNNIYCIRRTGATGVPPETYLCRIESSNLPAPSCTVTDLLKFKSRDVFTGLGARIIAPPATDSVAYRKDTALCYTPTATLAAPEGYKNYIWHDKTKGRFYKSLAPGKSWVSMRKGCTIRTDTFYTIAKQLDNVTFKTDTTICFSRPIIVTAPAGKAYLWQDGSAGSSITVVTGGVYWVSYFREDCALYTDTFLIHSSVAFDTTYHVTDTTVCLAMPVILSVKDSYDYQRWDNGNTAASRTISSPGTYWVIAYQNCAVRIDSFRVNTMEIDTSSISTDTIVCFANTLNVSAAAGFSDYLWNDNSTGSNHVITGNDTVWVMASNRDCKIRIDTFRASFINFETDLPERDSVCGAATLLLDATTPGATYLWQDGSIAPVYEVSREGNYTVSVSVGPCSAQYNTSVSKKEFSVSLGPDQQVCAGNPLRLAPENLMNTYLWQDGSTNPGFDVSESGTYWISVSTGKCVASDTVHIDIVRCNDCIAVPNAFTPNNDGKNDFFKPFIECPVLHYTFKIFNRYGQEVFSSSNPADQWDGNFSSQKLEPGAYYYLIKVRFDYPGATDELLKGDISLIR